MAGRRRRESRRRRRGTTARGKDSFGETVLVVPCRLASPFSRSHSSSEIELTVIGPGHSLPVADFSPTRTARSEPVCALSRVEKRPCTMPSLHFPANRQLLVRFSLVAPSFDVMSPHCHCTSP